MVSCLIYGVATHHGMHSHYLPEYVRFLLTSGIHTHLDNRVTVDAQSNTVMSLLLPKSSTNHAKRGRLVAAVYVHSEGTSYSQIDSLNHTLPCPGRHRRKAVGAGLPAS